MSSDLLLLGGIIAALLWGFLFTNHHIDERADRIEKRLETLEEKEKEP